MPDFPALLRLSALNGGNGFQIAGAAALDGSGLSVSAAGDVNGDGIDDVVVGAIGADPNGDFSGASYVVYGSRNGFAADLALSSLNGANGFRISGAASAQFVGASVATAGDINGDGIDDLIVGGIGVAQNGPNSGAAFVVFGTQAGFPADLNVANLDSTNGFMISGGTANDRAGSSVSSAGDVNGDGFDDVIVGVPGASPSGASSGAAYILFGGDGSFHRDFNLSYLNGTNGFRIDGERANEFAGGSVSAAGDVNGDGYDDVIIGATGVDANGATDSGAAYVVFGAPDGFSADLDLTSLDGTNGFRLSGGAALDAAGRSVSAAGDVNGDGFDDLVVGASGAFPNGGLTGAAYVVFGKPGASPANLNLSSLAGWNGFKLVGEAAFDFAGWSVSTAGDVNGDGFDDLIVGAKYADPAGANSGAAYVVFGTRAGFAPEVNLSSLNGTNGFKVAGEAAGDQGGIAVSAAGDVNGDGFDDLIVGANGANANGTDSGASYVIFGRAPTAAVNRVGSAADQTMSGGRFDDRLAGLGGDDELFGGAGADRLVGGPGDDILHGGQHADLLIGGAGRDGFVFDTRPNAAQIDHVRDFRASADTFLLDAGIFTALDLGQIGASSFKDLARGRVDADDRILYDSGTGDLYYDANGSAAGGRVQLAILDNEARIEHRDFVVI